VKTSGLPCRADINCEAVYRAARSDSVESVLEAASERNAHELAVHGYTHVVTTTLGPSTFAQGPSAPRRRGRRRREEELNVI
jgi:hypothetical protein